MNISSMTGFAKSVGLFEYQDLRYSYTWEIKSVNAKGLEIKSRLPQGFEFLDLKIKNIVTENFVRGTFNINLGIENQNNASNYKVDTTFLSVLKDEVMKIYLSSEDLFTKPSPAELLSVTGVINKTEEFFDDAVFQNLCDHLLLTFKEVIKSLKEDRLKEGEKILSALMKILDSIEAKRQRAEEIADLSQIQIKNKILEQIKTLTSDIEVNPERLEQEVLFYVMRADVKEELDRLKAHVLTARELFATGGAV